MALYLLNLKPVSRSQGRTAVGAAAYRAGVKLYDSRIDKTHNYTRRKDVLHKEILLPDNSPSRFLDREVLWNEAEFTEKRKDSRVAKEMLVALQREFFIETSIKLVREFISKHIIPLGLCVDFAIHTGDRKGKHFKEYDHEKPFLHNPHSHILMTDRPVDEKGFCTKKNLALNKVAQLMNWRKQWAEILNQMFIQKGINVKVSHESYKDRGIKKTPSKHLGPTVAAMERNGIKTRIGDFNREVMSEKEKKELQLQQEYQESHDIEYER